MLHCMPDREQFGAVQQFVPNPPSTHHNLHAVDGLALK